ncbi:MAG TPA: SUF system Fe-S cluster assembly regulator [Gammaproteobacteria bacterium]|jgi:FeS assembly SUF system regulator|nr:SUF system Fe-S cluster assembly regulator [Gammaproteobacteria bacterium]
MLRINRMSDYGMLILGDLALRKDAYVSATDIASSTHIALPTVQKLLKKLHKKELVISKQGPLGGYALHDSAKFTSVAMIIQALEGDLSLTQCTSKEIKCAIESSCQIGDAWHVINRTIISALEKLTLLDLVYPSNIKQFVSLDIPVHSPTKN